MKYFFIFSIATCFTFSTYSYEVDQISEGDTLESIAKRNHYKVLPRYENFEEYTQGILNWNPRIKDWNNLEPGEYIFVDYPYDIPKFMIGNKTYTRSPYEVYSDDIGENKFTKFIALTSSLGTYNEVFPSVTVNNFQNFPITFGMSFSYKIEENLKYILSSFYYAYSPKANVRYNEINKEAKIPGEFGATFYYQYFIKNKLAIYSGIDIEKLNTINTLDIINNNADLQSTQYNVIYGTIGISKNFYYKQIPMGLKGSISKLTYSSRVNGTELQGFKYILFYSIRPFGKINYNLFYKHHSLSGPSNLTINRIGIGISFML